MTQEFSEVTLVNNIIEQIASGINTVNQIAQRTVENLPTVLYSLDKLINIGLVEKNCITEEKIKRKRSMF